MLKLDPGSQYRMIYGNKTKQISPLLVAGVVEAIRA